MNRQISRDNLIQVIKQNNTHARESFQIAKRLKQLLPDRLKALKSRHFKNRKAAEAERLALVDSEYQQNMDEYLSLIYQANRALITYETHKMLFQARQTIQGFHLVRQQYARTTRPSKTVP